MMLIQERSPRRLPSHSGRWMPTQVGSFQPINRAEPRQHLAIRFFKVLEPMDVPALRVTSRKMAGRSAPKACRLDLTLASAPIQYSAWSTELIVQPLMFLACRINCRHTAYY